MARLSRTRVSLYRTEVACLVCCMSREVTLTTRALRLSSIRQCDDNAKCSGLAVRAGP